ncbi:MAG: hypothetical protein ACREIF_13005, partial [Chthoniobacterales bacterium]
TMLELYANGSNGQIVFVDSVTIGGGSATIIAGNTVTINNNKIVTVMGATADVYTGFNNGVPNANYTGSGGNGSTTGTFAGSGANPPQPISNAPPFGPVEAPATASTAPAGKVVPLRTTTTVFAGQGGGGTGALLPRPKRQVPIVRVTDSNQLLDLADRAVPGSPEMGQTGSNTQTRRNSRGPGNALQGKRRAFRSPPNVVRADLAISRSEGRSAMLPR